MNLNIMTEKELLIKLKQYGENQSNLTCVILDIDNSHKNFGKEIKSNIIDYLLVEICQSFNNAYTCRFGRDAFLVLIPDNKISLFEIPIIKENLQKKLQQNMKSEITFCIGIANYPENVKNISELTAIASEALFDAKQKGINKIEIPSGEPMKLKSLYFRKGQLKKLSYLSETIKESESYIIRKALDEYFDKHFND
ncbi:diguanylate cyclase [Bacillus aquiflavi]|uniref:Diguanylate cyclase n=1 Tax=Bacillus aquiflavi TaxID=2672567 RepID=A0A6B3VYR3_9BACI|nr:diguanylate cyclase [Bacillus aquiflavi]MBA4536383.1 diguanylate cyclase [Bacillus aquiflavi]NEY80751.1 diguanylate cyclase [Bacillus aquiflavi]UAC48076.1 diguanylate cyclase [Bacillus aquiflavi]